jgi:hypothetical protein
LWGYCTLFLMKISQWSGGGLPIDRSPWNTDQGSLMGWWIVFICNFFSKMI